MKKPLILLAVLSFLFLLFSYLFIDANLFYLKSLYSGIYTNYKGAVSILYVLLVIGLFAVYLLVMKRQKEISFKRFLKLLLPTLIFLLLAYPAILSYDIFNYLMTAKVTYFFHENPYIVMPIELINEPTLIFTRAANKPALYGSSWILLTSIPYYLSFGNFLLNLYLLKLLVSIFYIATCFLLYRITKSMKPLIFFACNPLVLIETFVSGHNDIVMMFFALLAFYLLERKKFIGSGISLVFSIMIKYSTIFILPLYLVVSFKKIKNENINWNFIGLWGFISMLIVFFLSPIREEIYPWYAIWFLLFSSLCLKNKAIRTLSIALSFGLMLRYVPFMLWGSYFGIAIPTRTLITFAPVFFLTLWIVTQKLWLKK